MEQVDEPGGDHLCGADFEGTHITPDGQFPKRSDVLMHKQYLTPDMVSVCHVSAPSSLCSGHVDMNNMHSAKGVYANILCLPGRELGMQQWSGVQTS